MAVFRNGFSLLPSRVSSIKQSMYSVNLRCTPVFPSSPKRSIRFKAKSISPLATIATIWGVSLPSSYIKSTKQSPASNNSSKRFTSDAFNKAIRKRLFDASNPRSTFFCVVWNSVSYSNFNRSAPCCSSSPSNKWTAKCTKAYRCSNVPSNSFHLAQNTISLCCAALTSLVCSFIKYSRKLSWNSW